MPKRSWKYLSVGVVAVLIAVLVAAFTPIGITINREGFLPGNIKSEGFLSVGSNVVLAVGNPPGSEFAEQSPQIERELVESVWMRTKNSKVFHSYEIPNRDYHDIYLDAVHYEVGHEREIETETGPETIYWTTWEDIDNALELAGELSPWDWQMTKADYHIYILEDFTYGQILKFEKADPYGTVLGDVAFQPMALQWTNGLNQIQEVSKPQTGVLSAADNKIEWDGAYGSNIDFSWSCYSTRLVKLLTISSLSDLPIPEQYIIDGGSPVLELNLIFDPSSELDIYVDGGLWDKKSKVQTFNIIEFGLGEETLWGFMPFQVWDSSEENEVFVIQQLRKAGKKLYVSVRVPYDWIQNAVFPIYIDAVVDEWVETSSDDAYEIVSDGSMDLVDTITDLGFYTGGPTHAGFRFTGIDTTDVENVTTAYLEFYPAQSDTGVVSYTWYGEDVASATTFTTGAYDISNRAGTTASVVENPPTNWASRVPVHTADLSSILNEVFAREDWVSGNDLAILNIYNSGDGERRLRSWDYNDHSKAPKLHFENPTEVTYHFNAYTVGVWVNPDNLVDGDTGTFAASEAKKTEQVLTGNNCPGTDLGTITKVELRVFAYGDGNDRIDITPIFTGGNGDAHPTTPVVSPGAWTAYVNITNDTNHPDWSLWSHIQDLDCLIDNVAVSKANVMYAAKVEIRVTYHLFDIDTGSDPIDRASDAGRERTWVDKDNPANASGTLHTVKVWAHEDITGLRVGTFYVVSGNTLKCRDSVVIGNVVTGLQTFTELSIDVVIGDYIGCYFTDSLGGVARDLTGFSGCWYIIGEYIDPNDEVEYTFLDGDAISLLGYGDAAPPPDIDVGADPIDRSFSAYFDSTYVAVDNPANASGILHSVRVYVDLAITGLRVGTFYTTNGNTLKCRDSVAIGNVSPGFHTFTELSITVEAGDYIGCFFTGGSIDRDLGGFSGLWYVGAEYIDPDDEAVYGLYAGQGISLYGYGDLVGTEISNTPDSKGFGTLEVNTTSSTSINYFQITNTGSGAVDIVVYATDLAGGDDTWDLSDTATPGENIYGLYAGLDDEDDLFDVIVRETEAYNELVNNLAESATQDWGLKLYMPTTVTDYDGQQMAATVTLVCSVH